MSDSAPLLAGLELGGTKCVCTLGTGPDDVRASQRVATRDPEDTLTAIEHILDGWIGHRPAAIGIGSFGPVDLDLCSKGYGRITSTPKPGWRDVEIAGRFARRYGLPVGFSTDVIGAALAEGRWGAARGLDAHAYVTVGTGIGVGFISAGEPVLGFSHTELGHIRVTRLLGDDWPGSCPFHGDCVEGLASGPAIEARVGAPPASLAADHPVWRQVAHALGQLLHAVVAATTPKRIVVGGGVMLGQRHVFPAIRAELVNSLNGYIGLPGDLEAYVVPPALGDQAGPLGTLALAADALRRISA